MKRNYFIIVYLIVIIYWLFSAYYFRFDRLYGDSAFYLFKVVNFVEFNFEHSRPSAFLVEYLPLILTIKNYSLQTIIAFFSYNEAISMVLISLIPFLLCKDVKLSIASMLPLLIGIRWNYFNPVSELVLAAPIFVISLGLFNYYSKSKVWNFLFGAIGVFLIFSHPLYSVFLPLAFILLSFYIDISKKTIVAHLVFMLFVVVLHFKLLDQYDQNQMSDGKGFFDLFKEVLRIKYTAFFTLLIPFLLPQLIAVFFILKSLFQRKKLLIAVFGAGIIFGYLAAVWIKFHNLFPDTFETFERYCFPSSLVIALWIYLELKQHTFQLKLFAPIFLVFLVIFAGQLFAYGEHVKTRNNQLLNVIYYGQEHHLSKIAIKKENFNPVNLGHDWIMANESLLLSSAFGNKKAVQTIIEESWSVNEIESHPIIEFIFAPWRSLNYVEFNSNYFSLYPQKFTRINQNQNGSDSNILHAIYNMQVSFENRSFSSDTRKLYTIKLDVGSDTLYSNDRSGSPLLLKANWINDKGLEIEGGLGIILLNTIGTSSQLYELTTPKEKGIYYLNFGVVFQKKLWPVKKILVFNVN